MPAQFPLNNSPTTTVFHIPYSLPTLESLLTKQPLCTGSVIEYGARGRSTPKFLFVWVYLLHIASSYVAHDIYIYYTVPLGSLIHI